MPLLSDDHLMTGMLAGEPVVENFAIDHCCDANKTPSNARMNCAVQKPSGCIVCLNLSDHDTSKRTVVANEMLEAYVHAAQSGIWNEQ